MSPITPSVNGFTFTFERRLAIIIVGGVMLNSGCGNCDRKAEEIVGMQYAFEVRAAYEALFLKAGPEGVRSLKKSRHDGIAMRAAWEEIRPTDSGQLDESSLGQFVQFVEARLAITIPKWWMGMETFTDSADTLDKMWTLISERAYQPTELGPHCPRDTLLERMGEEVHLVVGDDSIKLPYSTLQKMLNEVSAAPHCLTACFDVDQCYVAVHSDCCSPYSLFCFDRTSAERLWKADVWADGGLLAYTGIGFHWVAMRMKEDRVIIIGAGDTCSYIEAFKRGNGENLSRFSTTY